MLSDRIYNKFWDFMDNFLDDMYKLDYFDVYKLYGNQDSYFNGSIRVDHVNGNYDACIEGYVDALLESAGSNNNIIPPGIIIDMVTDLILANDYEASLFLMVKVYSELLDYTNNHSSSPDLRILLERISGYLRDLIEALRSRDHETLRVETSTYAGNNNYQFLQSYSWISEQITRTNEMLDKWGL